MNFLLKSIILGVVQGLTEFLPVSSSGHLAVAEHFLGMQRHGVLMETALHVGTLCAVVFYFRKDIVSLFRSSSVWIAEIAGRKPGSVGQSDENERYNDDKRLILGIIIGTIPTGLMGVLAKDWFESLFSRIDMVGVALMITSAILFTGETISSRRKGTASSPGPLEAFIIGVAQGVAIAPGISRSGATVSSGIALGLKPEAAVRFSFLLSIPAIMGAVVLSLKEDFALSSGQTAGYIVGPLVSAVVGYFSISMLISVARREKLRWFAAYCAIFGAAVLIASLAGM